MGTDKVFDYFRQIVFVRQLQSVRDMADNDLRTLLVAQILVRVDATRLVFRKKRRILHLPDIMIQSART